MPKSDVEVYIAAAKKARCPQDQIERFLKAGYIATPSQLRFHALARQCDKKDGPTDIALGGNRAGMKSHAILAQVGIDDCQRVNGLKFLYLRKTQRAASESFEDLVHRVLAGVPHSLISGCIEFTDCDSKIVIGGYQNESDIDHYIGIEYDGLILEERTQLPEAKIQKLYGSIRTSKPNWRPRKYSSANPGGVGHKDFVKKFVKPCERHMERETRFLQMTYKDNPFVDDAYVTWLESLTGQLALMWREGSWKVFEGQFFVEFGEHNKERPFRLPEDADGRVWLSLDHGIAHYTVANVLYLDNDCNVHCVCTYKANGGTTEAHARAIWDMIESNLYLNGVWPDTVYYDPSMQTKRKLSEAIYVSDIKIYENIWKQLDQSKTVKFYPANNRKIDGCHIMNQMFSNTNNNPQFKYFAGYNHSLVEGIEFVLADENNFEIYAKQEGDDDADACFVGSTLVLTDVGPVQIKDLIGKSVNVLTSCGYRALIEARMTGRKKVYRLMFEDGQSFVCTGDHGWLNADRGWVTALNFLDEYSYVVDKERYAAWKSKSLESLAKNSTVYSITSAATTSSGAARKFTESSCSTVLCGDIITAKSQRVIRSITGMEMPGITKSTICSCLQNLLIQNSMTILQKYRQARERQIWRRRERLQRNGMEVKKGLHGTGNTTRQPLVPSGKSWLRRLALYAGDCIRQIRCELGYPNTAIKTAKPLRCVSVEAVGMENVYCLSLPNPHDFALGNGSIVHNCRYGLVAGYTRRAKLLQYQQKEVAQSVKRHFPRVHAGRGNYMV